MWRNIGTSLVVAIVLTGGFATRASAACPPGTTAGPFCIDGTVPDSGITATADPAANAKELGPINASNTKISPINGAPPPMLGFTNPNAQVDLNTVWLTTKKDTNTQDQWLYFGWQRDSNSGSGFISIEFEQSGVSTGCVYTGLDFVLPSTDENTLINTCNPWRNRQNGDFIIMWDQQGNSLNPADDIKKRKFICTGSAVPYSCSLDPTIYSFGSAVAAISSDRFKGEVAIDLSTDVFTAGSCSSFANIIPGTVTGNSDSADYKDTVFATFPTITNCGVLSVTKRTTNADGQTLVDTGNTFGFQVDRNVLNTDDDPIRYSANAEATDTVAADGQVYKIVRPTTVGPTAPGLKGGDTQTFQNLVPGTNYKLIETSATQPATYVLANIQCMDGSTTGFSTTLSAVNATATALTAAASGIVAGNYILVDSEKMLVTAVTNGTSLTVERQQLGTTAAAHADGATATVMVASIVSTVLDTPSGSFRIVVPDGTAKTDCVITNKFKKANVTLTSTQRVRVNDDVTIALGNALQGSETPGTITVNLYTNGTCSGTPAKTLSDQTLTLVTGSIYAFATSDSSLGLPNQTSVEGDTYFSWTAVYKGDVRNNGTADPGVCVENTKVTITNK